MTKKFEMDEEQEQIDFIQPKKTVGKLISVDVLDKLRNEIEEIAEKESKVDKKWAQGLKYALYIIDKYKAESEV